MIIFGQCTEDGDFQIKDETKQFAVSMFGFFPHDMHENLSSFFAKDLKLDYVEIEDFKFGENQFINVYNVCDRRTFDHAYVLSKTFSSKEDAEEYINSAIQTSDHVYKKLFTEIKIIDAEQVETFLKDRIYRKNNRLKAEEQFKLEMSEYKDVLLKKYVNDESMLRIIHEHNFEKI